MADPKGFMSTPRRDWPRRPVEERVRDWDEVYVPGALLPLISKQADRCMDCGIPFCHEACPLGNLIPEWNDLVSREDWRQAADRLHATNNFPEFTGRLCPAPCEAGCVLAINQPAVTIKNVEVAVADRAWELGFTPPRPPDRLSGRTVAVIGSGPTGLAAAQQLTRAGHMVVVYEKDDRLGGLMRYGIPEFKMEKHHLERRIEQMRAEGTKFRTSTAVGRDVGAAELRARHDAVVIATGATAWRELDVPGRELAGVWQAMEYLPLANRVCEGDLEVSPMSAAGKHVVIVGGGDTGADCLGTAVREGAASVTQLDIYAQPEGARDEDAEPWPTYPKIYRLSAAHEEARELGTAPAADADARLFAASTLRFDGEFRYDRKPVGALQSLDPERVILIGSVSKSLSPAVRLGWMVLPERYVGDVLAAKGEREAWASVLDQLALADLIVSGSYDRHVRRMRQRYRARRDRLVAALAEHAPHIEVGGVAAGLHAVLRLPPGTEGSAVRAAARQGVALDGLAEFRHPDAADGPEGPDGPGGPDTVVPARDGLVVGYATPSEHAYAAALEALCGALPPADAQVPPQHLNLSVITEQLNDGA
ncbi:glutamate synthase small subunit [Streptomyces shaanxiensis]